MQSPLHLFLTRVVSPELSVTLLTSPFFTWTRVLNLWGFFVRRDHQSAQAAKVLFLKEESPASSHNPVPSTRKEMEYQQHFHECGTSMWQSLFSLEPPRFKDSVDGQSFLSDTNILISQGRAAISSGHKYPNLGSCQRPWNSFDGLITSH